MQMSAESGVLHVRTTGEFSLEEAERTFVEMIETMERHKVDKVLFDGRAVEGHPVVMERFFFSEFAASTVIDELLRGSCRSPRIAYVLNEPMLDPRHFGETVAVNRGMQIKGFDNIKAARTWLGIAPAEEPAE